MIFRKHKPGICMECGVYFKRELGPHGNFVCKPHREALLAFERRHQEAVFSLERRKSAVAAWANINFERLEKQMQEERAKWWEAKMQDTQAAYNNPAQGFEGSGGAAGKPGYTGYDKSLADIINDFVGRGGV